ncbi:MAG: Maf family protein [Lachnospiraceae bacterium]|nr:Maf family protein [Lachnospiraceae bacterium]
MKQLILASGSPRRKEILEQVGLTFRVLPSDVEEVITKQVPSDIVMELSRQKAKDVYEKLDETNVIVLGADTVVAFDGKILGKPKNQEEAAQMLHMLSGKKHFVYTGVTLVTNKKELTFFEETAVEFYPMSEKEIHDYIISGEPMDKAGAYGIQGKAAAFIKRILGDYYNVVGLPIAKVIRNLQKMENND